MACKVLQRTFARDGAGLLNSVSRDRELGPLIGKQVIGRVPDNKWKTKRSFVPVVTVLEARRTISYSAQLARILIQVGATRKLGAAACRLERDTPARIDADTRQSRHLIFANCDLYTMSYTCTRAQVNRRVPRRWVAVAAVQWQ